MSRKRKHSHSNLSEVDSYIDKSRHNDKLDVSKDLIENSDYLTGLANELEKVDLDNLDSNLAYEVAYASLYLGSVQMQSSTFIGKELSDCKLVFDSVLEKVSDESIGRNTTKEYKRLLKLKGNGSYENLYAEKSYNVMQSSMSIYLHKVAPKLFVGLACIILLSSGILGKVGNFLTGVLYDGVTSDTVNSVNKFTEGVAGFILMLIGTLYLVMACVDIAYISIPIFRNACEEFGLIDTISSVAKNSVKEGLDRLSITHKVKEFDRIERNKMWLDYMIAWAKDNPMSAEQNFVSNSVLGELKKITEHARRDKSFYKTMAKIEFLHDSFIKVVV